MKHFLLFIYLATTMLFVSCYQETILMVTTDFNYTIRDDNYTSPVKVEFENKTTGADFYQWTFEGGSPSSSDQKEPGVVTYAQAGTYTIKLEAWNDTRRDEKVLTFSVDSAVTIAFELEVLINDFAPAEVKITNHTQGASSFLWKFENGVPSESTEQFPANVLFSGEGTHTVSLTVNNGRETFELSKTIELKAPINVDFDMEPSFDDFDFEVPFTAALINRSTSALTYQWSATGGTITNATDENTEINFTEAGTYTVTLTASNEKETKSVSKELVLKENSNLYTLKDIRFGIKRAENSIGCFYSLSNRKTLLTDEVNLSNGNLIDLVFFGQNETFGNCIFISPDNVIGYGFDAISDANTTHFVNRVEESSLNFTDNDFQTMTTDEMLHLLDIRGAAQSEDAWFTNVFIPRLVLFETTGGIKGVIRIKAFVSEGSQSYVLTDIKVQKQGR